MRPPPAITIVESATAEGIREAAEGVETPGSYQAAQLRVAEQYVEKLGLLAKENDTMIVPRSSPNVVPRTTGVGTIPRCGTSRSAVSPPGTFCPPLPPFVVDYVSR